MQPAAIWIIYTLMFGYPVPTQSRLPPSNLRICHCGALRVRTENENAATGCASRFSARRPRRAKNIQSSLPLNRGNENNRCGLAG